MNPQRASILALVIVLFTCPSTALFASNVGSIQAVVRDEHGKPIDHATVTARAAVLIGERTSTTNSRGEAMLSILPPGSYRITVSAAGLEPESMGVEVHQERTSTLKITMEPAHVREDVTVRADQPITDPRSAMVSTHITPEAIERLPIGRDYVAFAEVAPGVTVVPNGNGLQPPAEPASRAGNNYSDRGAVSGSADNTYYVDGFNITAMDSGHGDTLLDPDIILEENVINSGVPAEYAGGKGFVANLVTRSGSNAFSGSAKWYAQSPGMYDSFKSSDTRLHPLIVDQKDYGLTLGGPILRDRIWFFVAEQHRGSGDSITTSTSATPTPETLPIRYTSESIFGKLTWAPTASGLATVQYFSDPRINEGSRDVNLPPGRYGRADYHPRNTSLDWQTMADSSFLVDAHATHSRTVNSSAPQHPELGPANTLIFPPGVEVPAYERDLGAAGGISGTTHRKDQFDVSVTWFPGEGKNHVVKAGLEYENWQEENAGHLIDGISLNSLAPDLAGSTFADLVNLDILPQSEFDAILRAIQADPSSAAFAAVDSNHDGAVSAEELASVSFATPVGTSPGIDFTRVKELQVGVNNVQERRRIGYLQDDWTLGPVVLNLGMRVEGVDYIASDGSTILNMRPEYLPRIGATWSVGSTARQKVSLFYGKYTDPLLTPMIRFAGNLSGTVLAEQVFVGNDFFTYRVRGSATQRDAVFAPNLRNPIHSELALTWGMRVLPTVDVSVHAYDRRDTDLIEDYDPSVYFNSAVSGAFALTPADFGFAGSGPTNANFFLANLYGGKRRFKGVDVALYRRLENNWSAALQYSWEDFEGNSNSNASADLQGDFVALDPRQPWMYGHLPGSIDHQVKAFGSWRAPFGTEIGALFYWSSGAHFTESDIYKPTGSNIYMNHLLPDGTRVQTGAQTQPSYYTIDAQVRQTIRVRGPWQLALILDVFNVLNNQDPIRVEEGHNDPEFTVYGEARTLLLPRRYQIGARISF